MCTARALAASLLALALSACGLHAQASELQPGARVRLTAPGLFAGRYDGTILAAGDDSIVVGSPSSRPVSVLLSRVSSLAISRGKSRSLGALAGIKWGAPIGLGLGALILPAINDCRSCDTPSTATVLSIYTLSGVLYGAGIGALIGRERWDRFDLAPRTSMDLRSGQVRIGFALGL